MVTDGIQTYCGDHFSVYTNTESCMPKSNINVDYSSIKIATNKINQTLS